MTLIAAEDWDEEILGRWPLQDRSRRRVERIMEFSRKAIERDGVYALNLNNVAKEAEVNVATVYQFFPTKNAVIARLALREFDENYDRVEKAAAQCASAEDVRTMFTEAFVTAHRNSGDATFLRELWAIMEADRNLQRLNQKDDDRLAQLLTETYMRFAPGADAEQVRNRILLLLGMSAFAIRTALTLNRNEGERLIAEAKQLIFGVPL
ncbi:TetR family transcriptional regulator [Pacificimonas sp. WHA3]|uniref:TetR family transcriptional regulator n=1 Tax=Pacificimonas pallii TaxID=2827236 RepID=A0ABS6SH59_9SPHN|nr:TetR family transcriptional regulator [Pacificimonas pallii]MBV7257373.1 TetR family transcriptional regulator [Pacificimonas pallii]